MRHLHLLPQRSGRVLSVPQTQGYRFGHPRRRSCEQATRPWKGAGVQTIIGSPHCLTAAMNAPLTGRRRGIPESAVPRPPRRVGAVEGKLRVLPVPCGSSRCSRGLWGGSLCSLCPRGDEAAVGKFLGFPLSLRGQITVR